MANPQAENGHTDIANEILEALWKVNLSPYEWRVLLYLLRKTYGWHRKTDRIALSQFSKAIGIDRRLVHRTLKSLSSKQMTVIYRDDRNLLSYGFQKNYERWKLSSPKMTVISADDKTVISGDTHKRNIKKKTLRDSPNPAVKEFIDFWYQTFKEKFGSPYMVNGKKEGALIKKLLATHSLEHLRSLAGTFFGSTDSFVKNSGYTIGAFYFQVNKLVTLENQRKASW